MRVHDGDANVAFSYRIVGRRLGYEEDRLERAPASDGDPNRTLETWARETREPGFACRTLPTDDVVIDEIDSNGDIKYWRDDAQVHHVPKRKLKDIVLN